MDKWILGGGGLLVILWVLRAKSGQTAITTIAPTVSYKMPDTIDVSDKSTTSPVADIAKAQAEAEQRLYEYTLQAQGNNRSFVSGIIASAYADKADNRANVTTRKLSADQVRIAEINADAATTGAIIGGVSSIAGSAAKAFGVSK